MGFGVDGQLYFLEHGGVLLSFLFIMLRYCVSFFNLVFPFYDTILMEFFFS